MPQPTSTIPAKAPGDRPLSARDPRLAPWRAFVRAEAQERQLRMGRLADSLSLSKSGATRLIDRLVDDGLVCRKSCSSDARGAEARLTERGLDRLRTAGPTHLRGIKDYFLSAIGGEDLATIERTMTGVAVCAAAHTERARPEKA